MAKKPYTFIDLFAGCGGLSEGFYKLGYKALAHVEIDKYCCETLRERMKYYGYSSEDVDKSVIHQDITSEAVINQLHNAVGDHSVDLIIGGPPCQAYSSAGRARDFNGMKKDPRNFLFEHYVKILNEFLPKFFVFENVTGILTANVNNELIINKVFAELGKNYKLADTSRLEFNTAEYGVPQTRRRIIIMGIRNDLSIMPEELYNSLKKTHYLPEQHPERSKLKKFVSVREAIGDLPVIPQGNKQKIMPFSYSDVNDFISWVKSDSDKLYDHVCRTQNATDTERYQEMARNHWTFEELLLHRPDLQHEKQRVFGNSYVVQSWDNPARTIIAHLCKDGNQFIHPDYEQGRSISVREAARLQSFPDDFRFCGAMTQQFKQIGNAVPPLFAYHIAKSLKKFLSKV
ncbi:MAG: DNA cytosine methyltransferase [Paramuribaculum sp.]|nr:DNA cytosine methyltransferase [Paramuribaculum sp.]